MIVCKSTISNCVLGRRFFKRSSSSPSRSSITFFNPGKQHPTPAFLPQTLWYISSSLVHILILILMLNHASPPPSIKSPPNLRHRTLRRRIRNRLSLNLSPLTPARSDLTIQHLRHPRQNLSALELCPDTRLANSIVEHLRGRHRSCYRERKQHQCCDEEGLGCVHVCD